MSTDLMMNVFSRRKRYRSRVSRAIFTAVQSSVMFTTLPICKASTLMRLLKPATLSTRIRSLISFLT